jgi:hypothetical protein
MNVSKEKQVIQRSDSSVSVSMEGNFTMKDVAVPVLSLCSRMWCTVSLIICMHSCGKVVKIRVKHTRTLTDSEARP